MKILLADDEAAARYGMSRALQGAGREILEASDGNEALSVIREKTPDLVFLDLNMPKCDGLTVLANLREKSDAPMPEIIVVTANDSISLAVDCIRRGAADFLTKPFDLIEVGLRIKNLLFTRYLVQQLENQNQILEIKVKFFGVF